MFCGNCGTKVEDGASFCHQCGTSVTGVTNAAPFVSEEPAAISGMPPMPPYTPVPPKKSRNNKIIIGIVIAVVALLIVGVVGGVIASGTGSVVTASAYDKAFIGTWYPTEATMDDDDYALPMTSDDGYLTVKSDKTFKLSLYGEAISGTWEFNSHDIEDDMDCTFYNLTVDGDSLTVGIFTEDGVTNLLMKIGDIFVVFMKD